MATDSSREVSTEQPGALAKGGAVTLSPEEQLSGDMLMLTTGFMMCAAMLWLAIYWSMGYQYSTAIPLIFQGLSAGTIWAYYKYRRLYTFAVIQLGLILFTPFAMQWSIGNFVNSSGVSLWGRLAPVGAVLANETVSVAETSPDPRSKVASYAIDRRRKVSISRPKALFVTTARPSVGMFPCDG